jgi:uncharacterized protein YoxC
MLEPERYSLSSQVPKHTMDFSQVAETITMLALTIAQIETSMKDGDKSVDILTSGFSDLAKNSKDIIREANKLTLDSPNNAEIQKNIINAAKDIDERLQQAVISFQFYDRLTQRLDHASQSLEKIGHLIANSNERYKKDAWRKAQEDIKSSYTMEAERIMFEHIIGGRTIAEALEIYQHQFSKSKHESYDTDDEVELF